MTIQELSEQIGHSVEEIETAIRMTLDPEHRFKYCHIKEEIGITHNHYQKLIDWLIASRPKSGFIEPVQTPIYTGCETYTYFALSLSEKKIYNEKYRNP